MKQIPVILFLACLSLLACKKNPHFPQQNCPEPADCQLTALHTTVGLSRVSEGPEYSSEIFRGSDGRPVKHRGYLTAWGVPYVSNITYSGNRMTLTDSATGIKRMDVWFNACSQPDSATWYDTGLPNEIPARTRYKYNSSKKLTSFVVTYNESIPGGVVKEAQVIRDAHGNVLKLTDGSSITEWTYNYNAPIKPAQIYYLTPSQPTWSATFLLEQFGSIDLKPRHLPKTIASNMGGYQFATESIANVVISSGKVISYDHRTGSDPASGEHLRTVTLSYQCRSGHPGKF